MPLSARAHYEHDITQLQGQLSRLAELADAAVQGSIWALTQRDAGEARRVIAGDSAIDTLRYAIEEQALSLIALQQPLASDLRRISALLGLATELERVGDYAEGIAAIVLLCADQPALPLPGRLGEMASQARAMLHDAMAALVRRDASAAAAIEARDDVVDAMYREVLAEMLAVMRRDPASSEVATYYLWAAHNLERIADRTVNVAERAAFSATGRRPPG